MFIARARVINTRKHRRCMRKQITFTFTQARNIRVAHTREVCISILKRRNETWERMCLQLDENKEIGKKGAREKEIVIVIVE
jgi:hypothetical protein